MSEQRFPVGFCTVFYVPKAEKRIRFELLSIGDSIDEAIVFEAESVREGYRMIADSAPEVEKQGGES